MTTGPLGPYYHVGIVVADLVEAQAELTGQTGITWGQILQLDVTDLRDGAGRDLVLPTKICYSVEAPHLELIEEVPGTVWSCNQHSNLHHIGFWSDDLPGASAELTESGCPLQLCGRTGDIAPSMWAYHRTGLGIRIEIIDAGLRDALAFLFQPPI
jgi:Glyoxalase/Bleomycin resistance protein/Dioxygenase superfamily